MKYSLVVAWLLMAVIAFPSTFARAAQTAPPENASLVHMVVTVEARHGNNVPAVTRDDVMVFENRERDKVVDWTPATGDHAALEFFILIDDSSNFTLGTEISEIRKFIDAQPPTTKIGIAYMQNGMARIAQSLTEDHGKADKAIRLPLGAGGVNSSPYFALSDLVKHWPKSDARKEVLMISDGVDLYYGGFDLQDPYVSAAVEDSQRAGIHVFAIYTPGAGHFGHDYWRTYWGQLYLAEVADETGGESYYIGFNGPPVSFSPYVNDIEQRLAHQYLLSFIPQPEKKSGLRPVRVTTEAQNADLVAPAKIMVPAIQ